MVDRSVELHEDGESTPNFCFDVGLNIADFSPVVAFFVLKNVEQLSL